MKATRPTFYESVLPLHWYILIFCSNALESLYSYDHHILLRKKKSMIEFYIIVLKNIMFAIKKLV